MNSSEYWAFEFQELEKQILNLRWALKYSKNISDNINKCQILTNLGNLFSHIGRFSEAQLYWKLAIETIPDFPMAIGNIGFGLVNYANALYDIGQQSLFFKIAYKYLKQAIELDTYDEAKLSFGNLIKDLESRFDKDQLYEIPELKKYKIGNSKTETLYRKWCLKNRLFLNPLNDIVSDNIASDDCLLLPSMTLQMEEPPFYQTMFNQIKQELVSVRYLLYEGVELKGKHFSDRRNLQMDTLDYAIYSFSTEKVKITFRVCYSIFDKIAYILNEYLNLGIKHDRVSFRKIWHEYDKKGKLIGVNRNISDTLNWAFRGLFWLSKDLYEDDLSFLTSLEPDAKELAIIRNFVEHKSFKIVDIGKTGVDDNGLTYSITRNEFEAKTLKLFKIVRAGIIYLSLGINIEERKKKFDNPILPVSFIEFKDEYKI